MVSRHRPVSVPYYSNSENDTMAGRVLTTLVKALALGLLTKSLTRRDTCFFSYTKQRRFASFSSFDVGITRLMCYLSLLNAPIIYSNI